MKPKAISENTTANKMSMWTWGLAASLSLFVAVACGEGVVEDREAGALAGADSEAGENAPTFYSVDEVLDNLGVETADTPRTDRNGTAYAEDFHPLKRTVAQFGLRTHEIMGFGLDVSAGNAGDYALFDNAKEEDALGNDKTPYGLLDSVQDSSWAGAERKVATSGDVDGDGREESLFIYHHSGGNRLRVIAEVNGDLEHEEVDLSLLGTGWNPVDAATGDLDNDGKAELVIANDIDEVIVLDDRENDYALLETLVFEMTGEQRELRVHLGDVDGDGADELAVAMSDITDLRAGEGSAWGFVFDDWNNELAELDQRLIAGRDDSNTAVPVVIADVTMGDLDGDELEEVVFAGITEGSAATYDDDILNIFTCVGNRTVTYAGMIAGYADDDIEPAGYIFETSTRDRWNWAGDKCGLVYFAGYEDLFVNTITLGHKTHIQLNNLIVEYSENGLAQRLTAIPESTFNPARMHWVGGPSQCSSKGGKHQSFQRGSATLAVGDVTGDLSEEILFYTPNVSERTCSSNDRIYIWGYDGAGKFVQLKTIDVKEGQKDHPVLQLVDLDNDTPTVRYTGEHKLVFTEPIVMAALAAPPCNDGIGQATDSCTSSFGIGRSHSEVHTGSVEVKAGVIFGVSIADRIFTQSELEEQITVSMTASFAYAHEHSQSATVEWESGPTEDSVVFSTIPYDVYTYEVVGHPNPAQIGKTETIMLPREPISLMTELEFFNEATGSDGIKIGTETFSHEVGASDSYKDADEALELLAQNGGMISDEYTVGEGGGATSLGLSEESSDEFEWGVGIEVEYEVEITGGGILGGFTFGIGAGYSYSVSNAQETGCSGSVGHIDAENFADSYYSFGLFTYPISHPDGQTFQVIDYWVTG